MTAGWYTGRRLTKHSREYTRNAPPHVRAARMLDPDETGNIRNVEYLMTPEGPVPLQLKPERLDYDHYIEKQIKPIADGVLPFLNTSSRRNRRGQTAGAFLSSATLPGLLSNNDTILSQPFWTDTSPRRRPQQDRYDHCPRGR